MPAQTTKAIQNLYDGLSTDGVPTPGWRAVSLYGFDRTHASDTGTAAFRANWFTDTFAINGINYLQTRFTCPPDRIPNTDVYYKWHFSTNDVTSGDVLTEIRLTSADEGGTFSAGATATSLVAVDTQYEHYIVTFGPYHSGIGIEGSAMLRFGRLGSDGTDTYPDLIYHIDFQAWYQTDRIATADYLSPYFS